MRTQTRIALIAMAMMAPLAAPASATLSFVLDQPSAVVAIYPGPYASVDVTRIDSTHATIEFNGLQYFDPPGPYTYVFGGIGAVGMNINGAFSVDAVALTQLAGFTGAAVASMGSGSIIGSPGFGSFNLLIRLAGGYEKSVSSVIVDLVATGGNTWADDAAVLGLNTEGYLASAHIYPVEGLTPVPPPEGSAGETGFAVGAIACPPGSTRPYPDCYRDTPAPEPAGLAMMGIGIAAVGAAMWRRRRSH